VPNLKLFIETISSEKDLEAIIPRWSELADATPFLHPMWCVPWWQCFRTNDMRLNVIVVRDASGEIVGLVPFYLRVSVWMGRELRFLGDGSVCSEYLSVLSTAEQREEVVKTLCDWLHQQGCSERRGTWDLLDLDCFSATDEAMNQVASTMSQFGHGTHIDEVMGCWQIDFGTNLEDYIIRLSRLRRGKARRLLKQIDTSGNYEVKWVESPTEIEDFMATVTQLHQTRWQRVGESGCFADPRFGKFLRMVAREAMKYGKNHFLQLNYQGVPITTQFALRSTDTIYSYLVGVERDTPADSPGMAMNLFLIRDGIARGYTKLDFLRGDEPYKLTLRAERIATQRLHVFARYPLAQLRFRCWRTACEFKRIAKSFLRPANKTGVSVEQDA
jgi:CelD/BcsL family acetyltransferase involved in cellulose biosynthesis